LQREAQDVGFQPVVQVQAQLLLGTRRHPASVLIEPRLGLAQPAPRLRGFAQALLRQGKPQPVQHGPTSGPAGERSCCCARASHSQFSTARPDFGDAVEAIVGLLDDVPEGFEQAAEVKPGMIVIVHQQNAAHDGSLVVLGCGV
jgi:hypothetical protein